MQTEPTSQSGPVVQLPVMLVAALQDSLMRVLHDLGRLQSLPSHTMDKRLARFNSVNPAHQAAALPGMAAMGGVRSPLWAAAERQFQDPASQRVGHTTRMLQGCGFLLAAETMGQDEREKPAPYAALPPHRPSPPNPVSQSEMDAGSIELF